MRSRSVSSYLSLFLLLLVLAPGRAFANSAPNAVTDWALIVQQAIHNAGAPRSAGTSQILHTTIMLAVYDAVMAIDGGYRPFAARIQASKHADLRAAVATAAYETARARVAASQVPFLDQQYAAYMAAIPDNAGKVAGVRTGQQAAAEILAARADDNFGVVVPYECASIPVAIGEFEPDAGCPAGPTSAQPVDVKLGQIKPFTYSDPARFRPDGPDPLTSSNYADEFEETRDYGRIDSDVRTAEQTDIAYFWSENPYVHWNRNLVSLAISGGLDTVDTARFFAMVHTSVSDAIIAGFEAKYYYRAWRPRTAIPLADLDGNPDTDADPSWRPLLSVNHPEYPSGHGFWSGALIDAVHAFFRTNKISWTLTTSKVAVPKLVRTERTYDRLNALMKEIGDARVYGGLHYRDAIHDGATIGRRVAAHVTKKFFKRTASQ
jgi:hypothetical protein